MNPIIEKRLADTAGEWDFTTVMNGHIIKKPEMSPEVKEQASVSPPISSDELVKILQQNNVVEPAINQSEISFGNLRAFNSWYLTNRETFSEEQRGALNTLVGIEDLVAKGCKCNESERDKQAHQYYQDFFLINHERKNDLIDSIKRVGKFTKISFHNPLSGVEEPFLVV